MNYELSITHKDECGVKRKVRGGVGVVFTLNNVRTWVLSVHMKAACRDDDIEPDTQDDCDTLIKQYGALVDWISTRPSEDAVLVAGDFNRAFHKDGGKILNELLRPSIPNLDLTPPADDRICWGSERKDFPRLKAESFENNPMFEENGIEPFIYDPEFNNKLAYFMVSNFPSAFSYSGAELSMEGPYRLTKPGSTLVKCDGSMKVNMPDQSKTFSFANAYPSDHCPLELIVEY